MPDSLRHVRVVGAVITRGGDTAHADVTPAVITLGDVTHGAEVLCARRGPGSQAGLWEFPGGKVEPGETPEHALAREIDEELGCSVTIGDEVTTTTHAYDAVTVTLTTFWCTLPDDATPHPHEHAELRWVDATSLHDLDWAPADIPAVDLIHARVTHPAAERAGIPHA